ncbi:MAG: hypothetical protein FNT15_01900 [Sulfurovum sp.]|nr:MAG: hypothetical protein FNT15_01900 [Sulfurovum sp.]
MFYRFVCYCFVVFFVAGCVENNLIPAVKDKVSGKVTYDKVPVSLNSDSSAKLDYINTEVFPCKHILVKAINTKGEVVASSPTDKNGYYELNISSSDDVKIRAYAQMQKSDTPSWDVKVVDNVNQNSLYVIEGEYAKVTKQTATRNLHASSGWNKTGYLKNGRSSAPFAILDTIYLSMDKILSADDKAQFPPLVINWSTSNVASGGDKELGQIVTSNYDGDGGLWILGDENGDTDEFDDHIIAHEWRHYFEDKFSRSDSIGGSHATTDHLDIRVALGEGWGNAFSGMATNNPYYYDTSGAKQSTGWYMNLETDKSSVRGYYNEGSVQRILYDLYDDKKETHDNIALGFKPIYEAMIDKEKNAPAFTSLFTFIDALKSQNQDKKTQIDSIVSSEGIAPIIDVYGTGRDAKENDRLNNMPLYRTLNFGSWQKVCYQSYDNNDNIGFMSRYNKFGNRTFFKLNIPKTDFYSIKAKQNGTTYGDPDMIIYKAEYPFEALALSPSEGATADALDMDLAQGDYLVELYDATYNSSCFLVTIEKSVPNKMKANMKPTQPRVLKKMPQY